MIGGHVVLIFAVLRINQEIKAAILILHFGEEVRLPLGLLHDITDAVAAFWNAEVIERGHSRN